MSNRPNFAGAAIRHNVALVSTANTNRDGSGTIVDILTAGNGGTRIETIGYRARGVTTAGVIRWFGHNGSAYFLLPEDWAELTVAPVAAPGVSQPSAAAVRRTVLGDANPLLYLPAGWKLAAATHNGESFNVFASGADF